MGNQTAKKVKAIALKDFRDAGTGERFKKDEEREIPEGAFANYVAAGLVRAPDTDSATKAKPAA